VVGCGRRLYAVPLRCPRAELDGLYRSRWNVEIDLRPIKAIMGIDIRQCTAPAVIKNEVAVHLLA